MEVVALAFLLGYVIWKGSAALSEAAAKPRVKREPEPKRAKAVAVLTLQQRVEAARREYERNQRAIEAIGLEAEELENAKRELRRAYLAQVESLFE